MIKVYFESNSHAEHVATFDTDDLYNLCLPILKREAKRNNMIVTEREVCSLSSLEDAMSKVTVDIMKSLSYGDDISLNDDYELYHYVDNDIIVISEKESGDEILQCMFDGAGGILFEELI